MEGTQSFNKLSPSTTQISPDAEYSEQRCKDGRSFALRETHSPMRETDPSSGSEDPGHKHPERGGTKGSRSLGRPPEGGDSSLNLMG